MKRYLGSVATVLVFGVSLLGMGAIVRAQGSARQQPMEIPAQYPQYPPQGGPQQQAQGDPGAARISFIHGDVSTQRGDTGEWVAATLNTPVVPGDHVSTGKDSRTELQLDNANILRMSDQSTANVTSLSRNQIQLQVGQGLVNFDVLKNSEADVEIQTPNVAIHPQMGEGSFRILVNSDGETIVDVRKGSAEVSTPQGSTHVDRDQRIVVQGNADNAQYQLTATSSRDEWDKWNTDRDHTIESADSWNHTNPYYTGSQDLDGYGQWNDVPDYGSVWFPQSDPNWAPYRDGRWVFEPYYGWTWVSYEPWGWAPYHYGRWFVYGGRWGWWPGPVYGGYRPIWAPAYVSFLGFGGGGWGIGIGFGSVGWLPCGPGDRFYPWYGRGVTQVNININNFHNNYGGGFAPLRTGPRAFSNINGAFADGRIRDGVSSMRSDQFGRGRVPSQQQRWDAGSFRQASVMTGSLPVSPSRESTRFSDRQVNPGSIPNRASNNQRFFSGSRQSGSGQAERSQPGFNRGGNPNVNQPQQGGQQGALRPGFRSFGSNNPGNPGNVNQGSASGQERNMDRSNRQGGPNPGGNQPQPNADRPGFRSFGSRDSGNVNPAPSQSARPPQEYYQGERGYAPPPRQYQPQVPPQYQNYSRGNSGNYGYSRPPLNMQQPVVTPRGGSYSAPPVRSAPSGGGSRGGYSGGGGYSAPPVRSAPSGGSSSGGNHGGNSGGGHTSSGGHDRR